MQTLPAEDPAETAQAAAAAWDAIQAGGWPFQALCNSLCAALLSPRWEFRHGAATALREVLRTHASSAAVQAPLSAEPSGDMVFCTAAYAFNARHIKHKLHWDLAMPWLAHPETFSMHMKAWPLCRKCVLSMCRDSRCGEPVRLALSALPLAL